MNAEIHKIMRPILSVNAAFSPLAKECTFAIEAKFRQEVCLPKGLKWSKQLTIQVPAFRRIFNRDTWLLVKTVLNPSFADTLLV